MPQELEAGQAPPMTAAATSSTGCTSSGGAGACALSTRGGATSSGTSSDDGSPVAQQQMQMPCGSDLEGSGESVGAGQAPTAPLLHAWLASAPTDANAAGVLAAVSGGSLTER